MGGPVTLKPDTTYRLSVIVDRGNTNEVMFSQADVDGLEGDQVITDDRMGVTKTAMPMAKYIKQARDSC